MADTATSKAYTGTVSEDKRRDPETYQRTRWIAQQFDRYQTYWQPDLERFVMNARMLWGLQFGQWPASVVQRMLDQGRRPSTFNVLLDKAETFIGSVIGNGFEPRYSPSQGRLDTLTLKLQDMYYSDRALMDWERTEIETLLDSSCGVGYESMQISSKYHELGNIAFIKRNPRRILLDPSWHDSNVDNLRSFMTWGRFSTEEIMDMFEVHSERLKELRDREAREGINYGENIGITDYKSIDQKWGDEHLVMEIHWVEKKKRQWEYDKKNHCTFPDTGHTFHSKEDIAAKTRYIQMMELNQNDITYVNQIKVSKFIQAVAPTLDPELMLIDGKDIVQCGNCNLFPLGMKLEGQYQGLVDRISDLQRAINKAEMNIEDQQQRSARGSFLLDKALAGGDADLEEQIESAWNDTGARIWVAEGSTADLGQHGGILELAPSHVSNDVFNQQERRYRLIDKFSKVPAAMDARTESSQEPNKMFENKVAIGQIGQKFYSKIYEQHKKDKAMAYARQAKITYSGSEREFSSKGSEPPFTINRQNVNEDTGNNEVYDDIAALPEMKVAMVPAKDGVNLRMQMRDDYSVILQAVQADPNNRLLVLTLLDGIMDTITLPEDKKEELDKTIYLLKMDAAFQVMGRVKQGMAQGQPQQPGLPPPGGQPSPDQLNQMIKGQGQPVPGMGEDGQVPQQSSARRMSSQEMMVGTPQQKP